MICEKCYNDLGKNVTMEALGAGQFQCPDCRHCHVVSDAPPPVWPAASMRDSRPNPDQPSAAERVSEGWPFHEPVTPTDEKKDEPGA